MLVLDHAARFRSYPKAIRTDQGPQFTGKAPDQYKHGVQLKMIQAGKPTQNAFIESSNGVSGMSASMPLFTTLAEARILIAEWRRDYNQRRLHSALGYLTPAEFSTKHRMVSTGLPAEKECL